MTRQGLGYVIRAGAERGAGEYFRGVIGNTVTWTGERRRADVWRDHGLAKACAARLGGRVVRLVRVRP